MGPRSERQRWRYARGGGGNCSGSFFQPATEPFALEIAMTMPVRAALYLRVSTGRQAENDLSIPDQRRQAKGYCASRGWEIVAEYVEPGLSATDDRRPEFQRMIDAATTKPPAFDVILVHSFSRFFRDQFQLEFYVRRLAKLVSGWCRSPRSSVTIP